MAARGVKDRKVLKKVKVTLYLQPWVARKLKYEADNQSRFTEQTLIDHHEWTRPGPKSEEE